MIFANPSSIIAPEAVPHRRAHLWERKTNVGAGIAFQGADISGREKVECD
jgi:hypothetical protein